MLVCHCAAVNDRAVRAAVANGARTVDDIADACGAGGGCGGCHPALCGLLDDHPAKACGAEDCALAALTSQRTPVAAGR